MLSIPQKVVIETRQKEGEKKIEILNPCITETKNNNFPDANVKLMQSNSFLLIQKATMTLFTNTVDKDYIYSHDMTRRNRKVFRVRLEKSDS